MNSFSKNLSIDLKRDYGVNVISICPGKVRTKINPGGILDPQNVTLNIIDILDNAETLNGKFINLNKNILTWQIKTNQLIKPLKKLFNFNVFFFVVNKQAEELNINPSFNTLKLLSAKVLPLEVMYMIISEEPING